MTGEVSKVAFDEEYLASKDGSELRDMRDNWPLDGDELEALNVELELRGIPTEPHSDDES